MRAKPFGNSVCRLIREYRSLVFLVIIYTVLFFLLASRKYAAMNSFNGDAAGFIQAFWHTAHGRLLYISTFGMSYLGSHFSPIVLWVAPLYWLVPSAYTIYFAQSFSIAISGVPFYLLARKVLGDHRAALMMTAAYLFYPTVVTNNLNQIHGEAFGLPFLMAATFMFFERRLVPFLTFGLLGIMAQENVPFTLVAFGIYAALRRWGIKWVALPIVLAIGYEILTLKVFMPFFAGGTPVFTASTHPVLGRPLNEAIHLALTQPWRLVVDLFSWERGIYLVQVLQPLLLITPLITTEILLAGPALAMNLLLDDSYRVIAWHYGPTTGAFLCLAAIFGVRRLARLLESRWQFAHAQTMLALCICALCASSWPLWLNLPEFFPQPHHATLQKAVQLCSKGRSVVVPPTLLARLAERESPALLNQFDFGQRFLQQLWPLERLYTMDYIVFDGNERRFPDLDRLVTRDLVMSFYTNTDYRLILNENRVLVFENTQMQRAP